MALPSNILSFALRTAVAIGLAAWLICPGELLAQTAGSSGNRTTAATRPASTPTAPSRGPSRTPAGNLGSRPLGYGVPGFASGGAAATRARAAEAANAGALYAGGVNVYYVDSPITQQQAGNALFNTAATPTTAIAPFPASDNAAGQDLAPSATTGQSSLPGYIDAGAAGVRTGVPTIAFAFDRAPPDQIGVAIAARLNNLPSLHFLSAVRVDMVGGTAVLRGTVASDHDRALAGRVVMLEASVDRVVNLLVVRNPAVPPPPVPAAPIPAAPIPAAPTRVGKA